VKLNMENRTTESNHYSHEHSPDGKTFLKGKMLFRYDKESERNHLEERIRKLEELVLSQLCSQDKVDTIVIEEKKEADTIVIEEKKEDVLDGLKLERSNSVQYVAYRSYSPSFEKNLRKRAGSIDLNDATQVSNTEKKNENNLETIKHGEEMKEDNVAYKRDDDDPTQILMNTKKSSDPPKITTNSDFFSWKDYLKLEILGEGQMHPKFSMKAAKETDATLEEFLCVPTRLEILLFFGFAVCADSFLYVLTFLPIRFCFSLLRLLFTLVWKKDFLKFHRRHFFYLQQMLIVIIVYRCVLYKISVSMVYHWVRGQNMLKLYVLMAMVEVFDRLLCSFGQDTMDSLYWNTTSRPSHMRTMVSLVVAIVYASIHSLILFVHVATLNVAMNSADNAFLTILLSNNFAEIKSTVFKKYNKQNLFKITTSDICERFKLALFLCWILLLNYCQDSKANNDIFYGHYAKMCMMVFIAEVAADWIKHAFITKFNFIKSSVYEDYLLILAGDVTGIGHGDVNIDHTHAVVKRVGLAQIPLACVMFRFMGEAMRYWSLHQEICVDWKIYIFQFWFFFFIFKIFLGISVAFMLRRIIAKAPPNNNYELISISEQKQKKAVV